MNSIPTELITMGVSAVAGFLMKQQAEARKERHIEHLRALERLGVEEKSRERAASVAGKWIRRLLVAAIIFAVIIAPFLTAFFTDAATVVQYTEKTGGFLWGIFGPARDRVRFEDVHGYLLTPETRQALLAIIAFYFGQGAAK